LRIMNKEENDLYKNRRLHIMKIMIDRR